MKKLLLIAAVGALALGGLSTEAHAALDLGTTSAGITTDLTEAQTEGLPIFGLMFGVPLALAFFRRIAH